jgi:hypothetical protein
MQFGGRDVARAQLHHVTEMSEHPAVSLYRLVLDRMEAVALKPGPSRDLVHRITQDI